MGLYVKMLARYLRLPVDASLMSLEAAEIEVDMRAEPIFIDGPFVMIPRQYVASYEGGK